MLRFSILMYAIKKGSYTNLSIVLKLRMVDTQGCFKVLWINNGKMSTPHFTKQTYKVTEYCAVHCFHRVLVVQQEFHHWSSTHETL